MAVDRSSNSATQVDNGGVDLAEAIERLIPQPRGKGRLPPAPSRDAIDVAVSEAVPAGAEPGSGNGWVSPIVQQEYAGSTYYHYTSSDGLFVLEFGHEVTLIDDDGDGDTYVVKLDDPNT